MGSSELRTSTCGQADATGRAADQPALCGSATNRDDGQDETFEESGRRWAAVRDPLSPAYHQAGVARGRAGLSGWSGHLARLENPRSGRAAGGSSRGVRTSHPPTRRSLHWSSEAEEEARADPRSADAAAQARDGVPREPVLRRGREGLQGGLSQGPRRLSLGLLPGTAKRGAGAGESAIRAGCARQSKCRRITCLLCRSWGIFTSSRTI